MRSMNPGYRWLSLLCMTLLQSLHPACAHNIWVAQRAGEWALVLGEGAQDDAYLPAAVRQAQAVDRHGRAVGLLQQPRERNLVLVPASSAATLTVSFVDGYWSQGSDGQWTEGTRRQFPMARTVGYYQMYSRTQIAAGGPVGQGLGLLLEVIPLTDPFTLQRGAPLPVQVLFAGMPLAGVTVTSDYVNGGTEAGAITDAQGRAVAVITSGGLNVIKVSYHVARADRSEADEDGYAATLAFALPHRQD